MTYNPYEFGVAGRFPPLPWETTSASSETPVEPEVVAAYETDIGVVKHLKETLEGSGVVYIRAVAESGVEPVVYPGVSC